MATYKFSDIVYNITDKKIPAPEDKDFYIGLEHMDSGSLSINRYGSEVPLKGQKLVMKKGDILFGRRNTYLKRAAIAPHNGIFSAHGMIFRPKSEVVNEKFLPFFIASDYFMNKAIKISVGSLSPTVNWGTLKDLKFNLPDIQIQEKLAELLWSANEAKEAYKKLLYLTEEVVKAQFIEMFGDPVTNTHCLNIVPFKDFMLNIRYGTSKPPQFDDNGQYCFIRATNIKQGKIVQKNMKFITSEEAKKIEKCKLDGGEIIIVRSGANTGDTCVVTDEYIGHYAGYDLIISFDRTKANPIFFNELLNTHYMQMVVKPLTQRAAQPHLNAEQVQNLPMLKADLSMQNEFAGFVDRTNKSIFELQQTIFNIEDTIKSLMQHHIG